MATEQLVTPEQLVNLDPIKNVRQVPYAEYFVSGHRTCQGCESALVMKLMVKAAGPRTIVLGSTGCMYVANTTYYTTPWVVPWMHTQLGSSGSAALGTAAGLKALMTKGKMKSEPINVIAFCGDGGGADMGLGAISATLTHKEYNSLILLYDNESYANTDIQLSGMTPYGAHTTFSPPGKAKRIIHTRWKKNMAGMMAAGHPESRYVATVCASYAVEMMNKVRRALAIGVIDRDYSFGSPFHSGVVANEIRASLYNADTRPPLLSFICGLGGREVTLEDVNKAVDMCYAAAKSGKADAKTHWLGVRE